MKTPIYIKKSQQDFRNRKLQDGWKYFSVLAPADIIEKIKCLYKQLIIEKKYEMENKKK